MFTISLPKMDVVTVETSWLAEIQRIVSRIFPHLLFRQMFSFEEYFEGNGRGCSRMVLSQASTVDAA
jgi:hypothetical protein